MPRALRGFCSTSSTVSAASPRSCRISSMTCATILGARPSEGSSRSSTLGAAISARAMTRICRSPPDSVPAARRRRSASTGNRWYASFSPAARPARSRRASAPTRRFSSTVSSVITPWPSGTCATPARAMSSGWRRARSVPPTRTLPRRGRTNPLIARSSVVLPAPLAPSTAVIVPWPAATETPSSTGPPPYPATMSSTTSAAASVIADLRFGSAGWPGGLFLAGFPGGPGFPGFPGFLGSLGSEVGRGHRRIRLHLRGRAGRDQLAEVQHEDRVADRHHQVHPVLDDHDARLGGELLDQLAQFGQFLLGKPAGRLVEQQQPRVSDQRAGPRDPPAPAVCP